MDEIARSKTSKRAASAGRSVPANYLLQVVQTGLSWGLTEAHILEGTHIPAELLRRRSARIPLDQCTRLMLNLMRLGERPGFGFELGLNMKLTAHGPMGYALLSARTLGEAADIAYRYVRSRLSAVSLEASTEGGMVNLRLVEHYPLGPFRSVLYEALLTMLWRHSNVVTGLVDTDCELHFAWSEPAYFQDYRERLPKVIWAAPESLLRFPAERLHQPLMTADPLASAEALQELEKEVSALGESPEHFAERVRALIKPTEAGLPTVEKVAALLHLSDRSLKRKLTAAHTSFQKLLDTSLKAEAVRLMLNPDLNLQEIASRLGYQDPESFTRAFRRWTGETPKAYRQHVAGNQKT